MLDADCMGSRPVIHARAGLEVVLPPPSTPSQLKKDQLLRGFERAERVDRRWADVGPAGGRAWAYLRWRRSFFEAPGLR